jgi:hypothetical protein
MITTLIISFPEHWVYGSYEQSILRGIQEQIDRAFPDQRNLLFNTTWRPNPDDDVKLQECLNAGETFDNLFVVSTVDYFTLHHVPVVSELIKKLEIKHTYFLGNFDTPKPQWAPADSTTHYFNLFAIACRDHFETYQTDELILTDPRYLFISYNRKPYPHRLKFVKKLIEHDVKDLGVVTLGRAFPGTEGPDSELYFGIGENEQDYVKYGHWYEPGLTSTPHDIPHDLFSLHNMHYWKHHFLHIIGGTSNNKQDTFINQIDFKPIIGLRPFLINGQSQNYEFWERNGFRTFDHYFPELKLRPVPGVDPDDTLHSTLIGAIKQLAELSSAELLDLYNRMLPDLLHNRQRWYTWADEQAHKVNNLFNE